MKAVEAIVTESTTTEYAAWCSECEKEISRWDDDVTTFEHTCEECGTLNVVSNDY